MINIFIPIVDDVEDFCKFVAKHKEKDKRIYVGIRRSLKEKFVYDNDNIELHVFESKANKEEIINALQKIERKSGKLLVIRRPLTDEEYLALTTSESEITTLRAHHNKFVTWFKNFARKTIKKFFAFSFFEDISAICYSEFLHELVFACPNLSMATRINKYVGVDVSEIETQTTPVKKDYNKAKNAGLLTIGVGVLAGSIAGAGCIFAFVNPIKAIFVVLVIAMLFVAFTIFAIMLVNYTRTIAVGQLEYNAGKELEMIPARIVEEEMIEEKEVETSKSTQKNPKTAAKAKPAAMSAAKTSSKAKTETQTKPKAASTAKKTSSGTTKKSTQTGQTKKTSTNKTTKTNSKSKE